MTPSSDERPGKFESDFTVIDDDFGSGEFGRVLKVRRIVADDEEFISMTSKDENVFAVKKSKPMEGVKHRCVHRPTYSIASLIKLTVYDCEKKLMCLGICREQLQMAEGIQMYLDMWTAGNKTGCCIFRRNSASWAVSDTFCGSTGALSPGWMRPVSGRFWQI